MTSLKLTLQSYIKSKYPESVSYNEIIEIARENGRKESNAERRLRSSESPMIETIYGNNHIVAYRYKQEKFIANKDNSYRKSLVSACVKMGCKNAEEILSHITSRTGIVFEESSEIDDDTAKYLLTEFEINKPYVKKTAI